MSNAWIKEFPGAITVCDAQGTIIEMNDQAIKTFEKYGGQDLIGKNLVDVHPEPSRTKVAAMLDTKSLNSYTIERNGIKKLIYQTPWYENGSYAGFIELSLDIPADMPHFVRKP